MLQVFSISAVQSWIKRYIDLLVYGKYNNRIVCGIQSRPVFFAKIKRNSTAIFNLKIVGPESNGTICMSVSAAEVDDLAHASVCVLSTSIPSFFNNAVVYVASLVDSIISEYVFVGFSVPMPGNFDISMQAVSSEKGGVVSATYSVPVESVPHMAFPVSDGYLAGYPVVKPIRELDAFHKWNPNYQYYSEDPVFFAGSAYFANPADIPHIGESPIGAPGKWIQLARPDTGVVDLTEGAKTPQLFYSPGLIISNTSASKLRQAGQDQGMAYLSRASKVYHLDGDLLDQDRLNPLNVSVKTVGSNIVTPHFISEDSPIESPITPDPAIFKKPFKEKAESYFGSYSVELQVPNNVQANTTDFWFKPAENTESNIVDVKLTTGEAFVVKKGYEEPRFNDYQLASPPDDFPFNSNELDIGSLLFNERISKTGLVAVFGHNCNIQATSFEIPDLNLPEINRWNHIAIEVLSENVDVFVDGYSKSFSRLTHSGVGGASIVINKRQSAIVLDELLFDWTVFEEKTRFDQISRTRLPWAHHEWAEGWLTIYADSADRFDSNIALHIFPVGSVITQTTTNGVYNPDHVPWERFHNFKEEQFVFQGEVTPSGGNGERTKFWQRVS